jgi:hypothetical protein
MRRTSSGSARAIFCRIRWTGERGISSPRLDNDRALVRGAATGVPGASATRAFVFMVFVEIYAPENINPAYPESIILQIFYVHMYLDNNLDKVSR